MKLLLWLLAMLPVIAYMGVVFGFWAIILKECIRRREWWGFRYFALTFCWLGACVVAYKEGLHMVDEDEWEKNENWRAFMRKFGLGPRIKV